VSYKIEQRPIPGLPQQRKTTNLYVVAHESGNPKNTGPNSLEQEIKYMTNNWRNAFTSDWVGGGGRIVQLAPVGRLQGGAGPKANPYCYAHVELARTDNPETFKKDYAAYIWLLRKRASDAGIPLTFDAGKKGTKGIKSHEWITKNIGGTTHTDPFGYLASHGITRAQFKRDVETGVPFGGQVVQASKPSTGGAWDVRFAETGTRVGEVQRILNDLGYYKGAIDNSFGPAMLSAVKAFQRDHKLTQDGIFGPGSQAAAKKAQADKQAAKKPLYRVIRDGEQVGAYREGSNVLAEAQKAIASGAKNIKIEKV